MKSLFAMVSLVVVFSVVGAQAQSGGAYGAGYRLAKQRGLPDDKAKCMANVYKNYASRGPHGNWTISDWKAGENYRGDLWVTCKIQR